MGRLLGRIGGRVGVAAGLIGLVAIVVTLTRMAAGTEPARLIPQSQPSVTVPATAGDDGVVTPSPSPPPDDADLRAAAARFAAAWLDRDQSPAAWHAGLARLATESLGQSLAGVDPSTVPATRAVGAPAVTLHAESYAIVTVPVDTGTLRLSLLADEGRWVVDGIDWERA